MKRCSGAPIHHPPSHWPARFRNGGRTTPLSSSANAASEENGEGNVLQRKRTQDFKLDAHLAAEIDVETESFAMEGVLETAEDCTGASSGEFLISRIGAHLWGGS